MVWYIHSIKCYVALKSVAKLDFIMYQNIQDILLNEKSKQHDDTHSMISVFKKKKNEKKKNFYICLSSIICISIKLYSRMV